MSVQAPEAAAPKRENVFTHKIGPLPMWAWLAIIGAALVMWRLYAQRKNQSAAAAAGDSAAGNPNTVPQFVNQTYTTVTAPAAPGPGPAPPGRPHPVPSPGGGMWPPSLPEPTTISGSPGSYTTGLQGGKLDEWTSTGKYSLNVIAKSHGMTVQQLIHSSLAAQNNVGLQQYVKKGNLNAPLPAGVQLFFPAANWAVR